MRAPSELLPVLVRLTDVLKQLNRTEEAKADAASSSRHQLLDSILSREQALILDMRGLEQKRLSILEKAGLKDATFRQLLEAEDEEGRTRLFPVFEELTQAANQLKETKESADRILKVRLRQIELMAASQNGPHYDEYG